MPIGAIIGIIIGVLLLCCCLVHRRVIKALIKHEPMPKAPKWHVWVKPENRRGLTVKAENEERRTEKIGSAFYGMKIMNKRHLFAERIAKRCRFYIPLFTASF